jgi:trimethylamine-N-oxide reductase (cytochrome c)
MAEKITHSICVGGPIAIHTVDGVIRRIRPIVLDNNDPKGWVIKARGKEFTPDRKVKPSFLGMTEKNRAYSYDRIRYPMIREDFVETKDGKNRNTENRGKSGYRRASWDEALDLVAREIKRIQGTYGKESVTAITSSHHSWGLVGYKLSSFARFFRMLGYTEIKDNPDSWEGFTWGAPHTYGYYWRLGGTEAFDLLEDGLQNVETMIMWSHDPDTTRGGYAGSESSLWRQWLDDLGVQFIYIDPYNNFSSVKQADKWFGPRPGTDAALCEGIAYVWLTEGTYDKEYIAKHAHRFDEWADYILGKGADRTPKTPKWCEAETGILAADIKALARRWASTKTMGGSGMRGGFGGVCRTANGTEFARIMVQLFAMQGMGKPGQNIWSGSTGAPMDYDFWFGGYSDPLSQIANQPVADKTAVNCVTQKLYRPNLPDAILTGHYEWYGEGFCGGGVDLEFTQHIYPEPGCNKVHMFYRYGGTFMGSMLDTNKWIKMYQSPELEFIVNQDIHFHGEARMADVILPACTNLERIDIGELCNSGNGGYQSHSQTGNNWQLVVFQDKAIEPLWESQSDYWIFANLAKKLGWGQEFTEGRTELDWCKRLWEKSDLSEKIAWEDFIKKGYYVAGVPEDHKRYPGFRWFAEGYPCDTPNHKPCQEEGKLGTFTGKFEFVSESLLYYAPHDEARTPIATYKHSWEGHHSIKARKYPFHLISPHPRFDYHTQHNSSTPWFWEIPENRVYINGNPYLVARIHPTKAAEKGIKDGDMIELFNERGSVLCVARVTYRVEVNTIHAYGSSGIYNPTVPGEASTDIGGCVNVLTPGRLMGDKVPGMAPNSTLLDVRKYEGELPKGQLFEDKLDTINKKADPDFESCVEIIEGHGFEKIQAKVRQNYLKKGAAAK